MFRFLNKTPSAAFSLWAQHSLPQPWRWKPEQPLISFPHLTCFKTGWSWQVRYQTESSQHSWSILDSKCIPQALSPSAASRTRSYWYISISFGLGFSKARKLSTSAGLRHRRKVIPVHKSLKMSPLVCSHVIFLVWLSLLIREIVIKQH